MPRNDLAQIRALFDDMIAAAESQEFRQKSIALRALILENSLPEVTLSGPKTHFIGNTMVVEMGD